MTQADIWRIAKIQSAIDAHCAPEDFDRAENVIVHSAADPRAPAGTWNCRSPATLSAMGRTLWPRFRRSWKPRYGSTPAGTRRPIALKRPTCMFSNLPCIPHGYSACFMAEYFLPLLDALAPIRCGV